MLYEYDLNDNLTKVTDREGKETTYVYDALNRITEIHRPNGISTYNTYNARNQITELTNICDTCQWTVSSYAYTYDDKGFIVAETAMESLAGYAGDDMLTEDLHAELYPTETSGHADTHGKDSDFAYEIVQTDRTFTYDDAGKLLSATETEDNYGTYIYTYTYDLMGNRTAIVKTDENGDVLESRYYTYNDSNQLTAVELYNGKKTTTVTYEYDADGNLISETGKNGTDKVELTYTYTVENRLEAVFDAKELLMAAAYDGDGNRVFQLNYNLHTDEDRKGNSGNGNGSNKDNSGSGNSSSNSSNSSSNSSSSNGNNGNGNNGNGNNGNGNGNGNNKNKTNNGNSGNSSANNGKGGNGKNNGNTNSSSTETATDSTSTAGSTSTGNGNATNAEANNSQNQCGILFPIDSETGDTEEYLISLIKTTGKEKNYELIEYINDVNREYTEVLVEQNINGALDTAYVYGVARLEEARFDGSTGYYLYDPRGSVTGITNEEGQIYQSYRYNANGEITFGAPQYENEYTYNGESYNPNIESQYLRARYYNVTTAAFITEDSYLGDITEPLTLNRYNYCVSSPLNYVDPSGHWVEEDIAKAILDDPSIAQADKGYEIYKRVQFYKSLISVSFKDANYGYVMDFDYEGNQGYFEEVIKEAEEKGAIQYIGPEDLVSSENDAFQLLDLYFGGKVKEAEAEHALHFLYNLCGGLKEYETDENRDYERYDYLIVGWTHYFNQQSTKYIDPEIIKGIMYRETKMGYYEKTPPSPNANATRDVMQVLDPRNSAIYGYADIYPEKGIYIYNENWEYVISTDVDPKYSFTHAGTDIFEDVTIGLFEEKEEGYYYQYDVATPNMSVAVGVKHYMIALEKADGDVDLAIRLYTLGHYETDPDDLKSKDAYVKEVLGARDGTISY